MNKVFNKEYKFN